MQAFRRTFYLEEEHNQQHADLYSDVIESLKMTLGSLLPSEIWLATWPQVEVEDDAGAVALRVSSWPNEPRSQKRLTDVALELSLEMETGSGRWHIELAIGQPEIGPIVVYEEVSWFGQGRELPLADSPDIIQFLQPFKVANIEGYTGGVIKLPRTKIDAFVRYLQSPERMVPVVLYVSECSNPDETQPCIEDVHQKLQGLAHVVHIPDNASVNTFNYQLETHPAFRGTVRLYLPGFQPSDSKWQHPFWPCRREPKEVFHELLNHVVRESLFLGPESTIETLRMQREESIRQETARLRQQTLEAKIAQGDVNLWQTLAEEYSQENDALTSEKNQLLSELDALRDQVRQLNWRFRTLCYGESLDEEALEDATPSLYLSDDAMKSYESLPPSEKKYWGEHVLPKLMNKELREHQSERLSKTTGGSVWVYPRKRTNDGRRVLYYVTGEDVYICELFESNDHDRYSRLRTLGVDKDDYADFVSLNLALSDAS